MTLAWAAMWWSGRANFDGTTYCEAHKLQFCDGPGFERLAPFILWPITVVASLLIAAAGSVVAPAKHRERLLWGLMVGVVVFIANRNQMLWGVAFACFSVWLVVKGDEVRQGSSRQRRRTGA